MIRRSRSSVVSSFTIVKGALIDETYNVFANWDASASKRANLDRLRETNYIGAASDTWLRDVAKVFNRRFDPIGSDRALLVLAKAAYPIDRWRAVLLWHVTRDEFLFRDFLVNWLDVRDVGKWVGTCFEYPDIFRNEDFPIASCAHTGQELVELANKGNRHGTKFAYKQFPQPIMKLIALFNEEVIYPLRYAQWYNDAGNAYDFGSEADLADLDRIHPRWTFEKELEFWGINDLKPAAD